eukprot:gene3175-3974_t
MPNTEESIYDHYDITDIIGEGTFSTVAVATHKKYTDEKYAIKVIAKETLNGQKREMVDWEISILSKCNHPNIVEFIEYFESDEDICLVLEWVPNGDLFDRIVKKGVFTEEEARLTMSSILSAVEYLHDRSLVHRDIKPENILFNSEQGDVKLADFGLSKYYTESDGLDEMDCGTPAYSAPEINSNQVYRKGVDMWSCGCLLYFILFGKPPFYHEDEEIIYQLVAEGQWSYPSMADKVSDEVKHLINGLLEHDPSKRLNVKEALAHDWFKGKKTFNSKLLLSTTPTKSTPPQLLSSSNSSNSLRGSQQQSEPVPIKQNLLRSSLNSSVEAFRGT